MKKLFFSILFALGIFTAHAMANETKSIFVNITSSDSIKAPMAIMFASQGLKQNIDMTIFLNAEGVRLAVKDFHSPTNSKDGKTTQEMITSFVKNGGKLLVCPMCLKSLGYDESNLISEAVVSDENKTFSSILSSDKVVSF